MWCIAYCLLLKYASNRVRTVPHSAFLLQITKCQYRARVSDNNEIGHKEQECPYEQDRQIRMMYCGYDMLAAA